MVKLKFELKLTEKVGIKLMKLLFSHQYIFFMDNLNFDKNLLGQKICRYLSKGIV